EAPVHTRAPQPSGDAARGQARGAPWFHCGLAAVGPHEIGRVSLPGTLPAGGRLLRNPNARLVEHRRPPLALLEPGMTSSNGVIAQATEATKVFGVKTGFFSHR